MRIRIVIWTASLAFLLVAIPVVGTSSCATSAAKILKADGTGPVPPPPIPTPPGAVLS